jgi:WD40 repeat protein
VGHHEGRFPIERLDISASGEIIASISHDQRIKFWSIKYLEVRTAESFWSALKVKIFLEYYQKITRNSLAFC